MGNIESIEDWRRGAGISIKRTQEILETSRSTVLRRIREGKLKTFRVGTSVRIKTESIVALIDGTTDREAA